MDKLKKHLAILAVLPGGAAATAASEAARTGVGLGVDEPQSMRIVTFCNTGERSSASSIIMTEQLGMPVRGWGGGFRVKG